MSETTAKPGKREHGSVASRLTFKVTGRCRRKERRNDHRQPRRQRSG